MRTYLLPVEGLTVHNDWIVGPVTIASASTRDALLDAVLQNGPPLFATRDAAVTALRKSTAAAVSAASVDEAIDLVIDALAVVRVFHDRTRIVKGTPTFGLAGEVFQRNLLYVALDDSGNHGAGFVRGGDSIGFTFSGAAHARWLNAADLQFVASCIGAATFSESGRRALLGCRLLSQAILEPRADAKLRTLMTALEVLVGGDAGKYQLAQRLAYLACGAAVPDEGLCGRDRPTCPYLHFDPCTKSGRSELKRLEQRALSDVAWRCSEWSQIIDWYDARNDAVHEGTSGLTADDVGKIQYWITRMISPLALTWLAEHDGEPIDALDAALASLPAPPDWEALIRSSTAT